MKLSDPTIQIIKNFASINPGIVLKKGKVQSTMSDAIIATGEFSEDIPVKFGIMDLNQFLGNINSLDNPSLDFDSMKVLITDGKFRISYYSASPEVIVTPPEEEIDIKDPVASFKLDNQTLAKVIKLASMNSLPHLTFVGSNGKIDIKVHNSEDDSSNSVSVELTEFDGDDFMAVFRAENFKMLPDDYGVEIQPGVMAKFTSFSRQLTYLVALEA